MELEEQREEETLEAPDPIQPPVFVAPPAPVLAPVIEPTPEPEPEEEDELADLFEVPQETDNDMRTDHLVEVPEEEDFSDLVEVSEADLMGDTGEDFPGTPPSTETPETRRVPIKRFKRTPRRYPPPTSLGGVRY